MREPESDYDFAAVQDAVEPVLDVLQAKIDAMTDAMDRRVWLKLRYALGAAFMCRGYDAEAVLLARAVEAMIEGRAGEAAEAVKRVDSETPRLSVYVPSPN